MFPIYLPTLFVCGRRVRIRIRTSRNHIWAWDRFRYPEGTVCRLWLYLVMIVAMIDSGAERSR